MVAGGVMLAAQKASEAAQKVGDAFRRAMPFKWDEASTTSRPSGTTTVSPTSLPPPTKLSLPSTDTDTPAVDRASLPSAERVPATTPVTVAPSSDRLQAVQGEARQFLSRATERMKPTSKVIREPRPEDEYFGNDGDPTSSSSMFGISTRTAPSSGFVTTRRVLAGGESQLLSINPKTRQTAEIPPALQNVRNIEKIVHIPLEDRPAYLQKTKDLSAVDRSALESDPTFNPPKYAEALKSQGYTFQPQSWYGKVWDRMTKTPSDYAQATSSFKYIAQPEKYSSQNFALTRAAETIPPTTPLSLDQLRNARADTAQVDLRRSLQSHVTATPLDSDTWQEARKKIERASMIPQPDPDLGQSFLEGQGQSPAFSSSALRQRSVDTTIHFITGKTSPASSVHPEELRARDPRLELQNTPENQAHMDSVKLKHSPFTADLVSSFKQTNLKDFVDNGSGGLNRSRADQQSAAIASQTLRSARVADKVSALRETVQHSLGLKNPQEVEQHFKVIPAADQLTRLHVQRDPNDTQTQSPERGHTLLVNHALVLRRDNADEILTAKRFMGDKLTNVQRPPTEDETRQKVRQNLETKTQRAMEQERAHIDTHNGFKTKAPIEHRFDAAGLGKLNTGDILARVKEFNNNAPPNQKLPDEHLHQLGQDATPYSFTPADETQNARFKEAILHPAMGEAVHDHIEGLVHEQTQQKPEPRTLLNDPTNMHIQVSDAALAAINHRTQGHAPVATTVDNPGLHQRPELASADLDSTITRRDAVSASVQAPHRSTFASDVPSTTSTSSSAPAAAPPPPPPPAPENIPPPSIPAPDAGVSFASTASSSASASAAAPAGSFNPPAGAAADAVPADTTFDATGATGDS